MIESAPEAIIVYTPEKFLFLNEFAASRLGSDPVSLLGRSIMEFVHPDSTGAVIQRLSQPPGDRDPAEPLDVRFVSRDGTVIPAEIVSVPIVFEGQQAFLGLIRDTTRRVSIESALRESEEKFKTAFIESPHGMAFVGPHGGFVKVNRALCEMLGYTEEDLLQRGFSEVTHPDDVGTDLDQLRRLVTKELRSYTRIKRYIRKDGGIIWVSLAVSAIYDASGLPLYFIGQMHDITIQRAMENERASAQRRAGITETTIAVAHELNNVLTVLMMNAELLAEDAPEGEMAQIASEILTASNRISLTVQRLRNVGNPVAIEYLGEKKMIDLSQKPSRKRPKKRK